MEKIINFLSLTPFEEYNKWLGLAGLILGVSLFIVYNRAVFLNYGWLKSISISYYSVKPRWLFQMFMWGSILAILCIGQNMMYLLVGVFFGIMTCNPTVNGGNIYFIPHMIGAITAITLGILGTWLLLGNPALVITAAVVLPLYLWVERKNPDKVYWIEIISLTIMMFGFVLFILQKIGLIEPSEIVSTYLICEAILICIEIICAFIADFGKDLRKWINKKFFNKK